MTITHPRRALAAGAGLVALAAIGVACSHPGRPHPPPPTTTVATTATTTATTAGPGATDCGTIAYASGWPTTFVVLLDRGAGRCFLDAWDAGAPARLITRDQTDGQGGHILIVTYEVLGSGRLRVTTDASQTVTPEPVRVELCTGLTHTMSRLQPQDCRPA